jgi:hypothetical protein
MSNMKNWASLLLLLSVFLVGCQSGLYEPDTVLINENYSESSKGSLVFQVLTIGLALFLLSNLGRRK